MGLANVRERLRLYFDRVDVMAVESGGEGKGASVTIRVPVLGEQRGFGGRSRRRGGSAAGADKPEPKPRKRCNR